MKNLLRIKILNLLQVLGVFGVSGAFASEPGHGIERQEISRGAGAAGQDSALGSVFGDVKGLLEASFCGVESDEFQSSIKAIQARSKALWGDSKNLYFRKVSEISNSFLKHWCFSSFGEGQTKFENCLEQLQKFWIVDDRPLDDKQPKVPVVLEEGFPNQEHLSRLKKVKSHLVAEGAPLDCKIDYLVGPANPKDKKEREIEHERITSAYVDALVDSLSLEAEMRSELIWVHGARVARLLRQNEISLDDVNRRTREVLTEKCQSDRTCINRFLPNLMAINKFYWQGALEAEKEKKDSPFHEQKIYELNLKESAAIALEMDHVLANQKATSQSEGNLLIAALDKAVRRERAIAKNRAAKSQLDSGQDEDSSDDDHSSEDLLAKHWPSYQKPKRIPNEKRGIFEDKATEAPVDSAKLGDAEKDLIAELSKKSGLGIKAITKAFEARKSFKGSVSNKDELVVIDFTMTNSQKRICVLNTKTKAVRCDHVAHGMGKESFTNPAGKGTKPKYFGNERDYRLGTFGAHVTAGSKYWSSGKSRYQRTKKGLEAKVNDNAQRDGKVFHECGYATYGRSHGCISTDSDMDKVLRELPQGTFIYVYPGTVERVSTKIWVPRVSGDPDSGKYRQAEIWKVVGP